MDKNDGGQAFPVSGHTSDYENHFATQGMSLRDWFAGMALKAVIKTDTFGPFSEIKLVDSPSNSAAHAYNIADAMLKERQS